jgi:hypothetical protein
MKAKRALKPSRAKSKSLPYISFYGHSETNELRKKTTQFLQAVFALFVRDLASSNSGGSLS